ncbi:MAG: AAA family ATPase [Saprospiraceae bacterium]|nr:AAA family ATPase [Saprospiraceae bacterium]
MIKSSIRQSAEVLYKKEFEALVKADNNPKPANWQMSPWSVVQYIIGGKLKDGTEISPKYVGKKSLIEICVATLLSERALLLTGVPGTAKTWISEHLAAAISGNSGLFVQGTSGTHEDAIKYGWNYASLIAHGPTREGLIPSVIMKAMETGGIARIEELSRIPTETQDALISILSEKNIIIHELEKIIEGNKGFNIIATANDLDRGIYEMSSALKRRFNIVQMPLPENLEEETKIVRYRVQQMGRLIEAPLADLKEKQIQTLLTLFRELREGKTEDKKTKIRACKTSLSPAIAISIIHEARIHAHYFDNNEIRNDYLVKGLIHTLRQEGEEELQILQEYNESVLKKRTEYKEWYNLIKKLDKD